MKNNIYEKSVLATATNTSKSENQDNKGEFEGTHFNSIFIFNHDCYYCNDFVYPLLLYSSLLPLHKCALTHFLYLCFFFVGQL